MSYCDFKPGDEVVCVRQGRVASDPTVVGHTYTVVGQFVWGSDHALLLAEVPNEGPDWYGHFASRFRKVQRRKTDLSIETFLTIKPGFEEPKRAPTPKRESVS